MLEVWSVDSLQTMPDTPPLQYAPQVVEAIFDELKQSGSSDEEIAMLKVVRDDFTQSSQIPEDFAQQARQGDEALLALEKENQRVAESEKLLIALTGSIG